MKVQLRKPFFPKKSIQKIQNKVKTCLESGYLTLGPNVKSFESNFSRFLNAKYAVAVSSATAGLHISLLSLGIKKGDEVIVPAKTFISTANAAIYCNAKPVFCDVRDDTFQIDPNKINSLISKKTKAIIPVHLGGNVCDMEEIQNIAKRKNIAIVEDAAHAHGATLNGKMAGTFGDIGVFSFYPDKVMSSGDGGIIVTDNKSIFEKLSLLRNVGRKDIGNYTYTEIGYNYRMNEMQAILAQEQLNLLPNMLKKRRKIASIYDSELNRIPNLIVQKIFPGINPSYYAYILRIKNHNMKKLRERLAQSGIETSPMFLSVYRNKIYEKLGIKNSCPVSEMLDKQTFTIPLHPALTEKQVKYVIQKIKQEI